MMNRTSQPGRSLPTRLMRWWKAQPTQSRYQFAARGGLGLLCFTMVAFGMPALSALNSHQEGAAELRERSQLLAELKDAGDVVRTDYQASALWEHDWLRTVEYSLERDPGTALSRYASFERDRAALAGLVKMDVPRRTEVEDLRRQTQCLATAIYYEARSEQIAGQMAVAEVVMNRVKDHRYPNTACDVVYQGATRTTGCQFTFTCDGALAKKPYGTRWERAQTIASHVMLGLNEHKTAGATHYHATYVDPVWNSGLIKTGKIGTHIFYRFPRGSEWSVAAARQSERLAQRRAGLKAVQPVTEAPSESEPQVLTTVEADTTPPEPMNVADLNAASLSAVKASMTPAEEGPSVEPVSAGAGVLNGEAASAS